MQAGGAGKAMAEWIAEGEPEWDLWGLDARRYTDYATQAYTRAKARELYQNEYAIALPFEERPAGRPAKTTPLYETLRAKGAMFGARGGWERAAWFVPAGEAAEQRPSFRRANWFRAVGEECRAVRERVGVLDLGGFAKFEVSGQGAAAYLDRLVCGRLPKVGRVALAYMCTPKGGILSELTITRLAEERFYLCSAASAEWHDEQWLRAHLPADRSVGLRNLTARYGTLCRPPGARCSARSPKRICRTPPFPGSRRAGSRSASRRSWRCASTTSASSAGSCTCRSSASSRSTKG